MKPLRPRYRVQQGFTLGELMVTLAVALVLAAVTVPSYNAVVARNEVASAVNAFVAELQVARSEAAKRSAPVSLCAALEGETDCDRNDPLSPWVLSSDETGQQLTHIVFTDTGTAGSFDGTDEILRRFAVTNSNVDVSVPTHFIRFSGKGYLTVSNLTIQFSPSSGEGKCLSVFPSGRASSEAGGCS
jgi:type IV fimbrial biogenesis protein FimT